MRWALNRVHTDMKIAVRLALRADTEVMYQVSGPYEAKGEQGFRWDEPEFGISWPLPITIISDKDADWPLIAEAGSLSRFDN